VSEETKSVDVAFQRRRSAFELCLQRPDVQHALKAIAKANTDQPRIVVGPHLVTCPCCGYPTLRDRGGHDTCLLCKWEDDGQDDRPYGRFDPDDVLEGPNRDYSLTEARENFARYGVKYREHDRRFPRSEDMKHVRREIIDTFERLLPEVEPKSLCDSANAVARLFERLFKLEVERLRLKSV
jgi:hypothetical protein